MVLDYYKLRQQPFGVTADPGFLYLSPTHREALASLAYGIQSGRGFMSLLAKPGMGKTTILFRLLEQLKDTARTVYLFQTLCRPEELLRGILHDLGIDHDGRDVVRMQAQLNEVLFTEARRGRKVIAVIDEAQNLDDAALELMRMLSNFESHGEKLMQIILAGQPQLGEKLASPQLLQLRQRMSIIARLKPFSGEETRLYIAHRLRIAGYDFKTPLFASQAEVLIAKESEGIPRNINNICFNALSLGWVLKQKTIGKQVIREVIRDLRFDKEEVGEPDRQSTAKEFGWIRRQPREELRARFGWRKPIAACAVLLVPLMPVSGNREPSLPQTAMSSVLVNVSMKSKPADVGGQLIEYQPVASTAKPASTEDVTLSGGRSVTAPENDRNSAKSETLARSPVEKPAAAERSAPSPDKAIQPASLEDLWAQVRLENSDAEIALARKYIEGTSVPRNCAQAEVLLQAATRRGNPHAIDLLNESECR